MVWSNSHIMGNTEIIDPCFHKDGTYSYLLYFDGFEKTVYSIVDVMNTPFVCGKSLNELRDAVKVLD